MPNDWFQFKQFTVRQDRCAMKVSTDACIQGAWAALQVQQLAGKQKANTHILDIGTGTGLLTLMLAQLAPEACYEAIELNPEAWEQAKANFETSPWPQQLKALLRPLSGLLQDHQALSRKYNFIICNPPFFHNQLQAPSKARNEARHSITLTKDELARAGALLLEAKGQFCVMYPASEWEDWLQAAHKEGLYPMHILEVQPRADLAVNRVIGIFCKEPVPVVKEILLIYQADKRYTEAFQQLLQPYYLFL